MTTRTRTARNLSFARRIELLAHSIIDTIRMIVLNGIAMITIIAVISIVIVAILLYTGTLTIEHISYITGDSYTVVRIHGLEVYAYQITGNWLQQAIDIIGNTLQSIVQYIQSIL